MKQIQLTGLLFLLFVITFMSCRGDKYPEIPKNAMFSEELKYIHFKNAINGLDTIFEGMSEVSKRMYSDAKDILEDVHREYGNLILVAYGPPVIEDKDNDQEPDADCDEDLIVDIETEDDTRIPCVAVIETLPEHFLVPQMDVNQVNFLDENGKEKIGSIDYGNSTKHANDLYSYPIIWKNKTPPSGSFYTSITEKDKRDSTTYNVLVRIKK